MRSKSIVRAKRPSPAGGSRNVLLGILLLLIGAGIALTIERIPASPAASRATPSSSIGTKTAPSNSTPAPIETPAPSAATEAPSPSPTLASAILEAEMPAQLGGVPLTVTSRKGTALLGSAPAVRAFAAAVTKLGASSDALEIAYGYDPTGSMTSIILAFRIPGVTAEHLAPVVIQAWLSAGAAGVTTSDATVSGRTVRHISYGDKGADEWVVSYGDAVFVVETPDATIAADAIASLRASPAPGSGSPVPTSAGVTSSPGASASP